MGKKTFLILLLSVVPFGACRSARAERRPPSQGRDGLFAEGVASYYGKGFDGRKTANGEIFDKEEMTAAHRTLRFGTCVVVENVSNGEKVKVRINDRGPFAGNRIIDVSEAAARELGFIEKGLAKVRLYGC